MKKYSKGKLKFKRLFILLIILLVVILIAGLILLFAFCLNDKFEVSSEVNDAANVSDDIAANSEPIIVDNLIVGAIYENTWVSTNIPLRGRTRPFSRSPRGAPHR